jgi:hypothetical protein
MCRRRRGTSTPSEAEAAALAYHVPSPGNLNRRARPTLRNCKRDNALCSAPIEREANARCDRRPDDRQRFSIVARNVSNRNAYATNPGDR